MRNKRKWLFFATLLLNFFLVENSVAAPLQATLSRDQKGWKLTSIDDHGGTVDLESGNWIGSLEAKDCLRGFFGITSGNCPDIDFVTSRPEGLFLVATPIVWPIGLVVGTVGVLTGNFNDQAFFPINMNRKFSEESYREALAEAIEREGGPERLVSMQKEYERLLIAAKEVDLSMNLGREEIKTFSLAGR